LAQWRWHGLALSLLLLAVASWLWLVHHFQVRQLLPYTCMLCKLSHPYKRQADGCSAGGLPGSCPGRAFSAGAAASRHPRAPGRPRAPSHGQAPRTGAGLAAPVPAPAPAPPFARARPPAERAERSRAADCRAPTSPARRGLRPQGSAMVIVEPRKHHHLKYVLDNFDAHMPLDYDLYIFHGPAAGALTRGAPAAAPHPPPRPRVHGPIPLN
jgi:hypothetical protein